MCSFICEDGIWSLVNVGWFSTPFILSSFSGNSLVNVSHFFSVSGAFSGILLSDCLELFWFVKEQSSISLLCVDSPWLSFGMWPNVLGPISWPSRQIPGSLMETWYVASCELTYRWS